MFRSFFGDRKLLLMVALLLGFLVLMALIWRHYDRELQRIDQQIKESKGK